MRPSQLLEDAFTRIQGVVQGALDGIDPAALAWQPDPGANPIGWLVWHLTRVQDDHIAELLGEEQVWVTDRWATRFGLAADTRETGYGHTPEQVMAVRPDDVDALMDHLDAVTARTHGFLQGLGAEDLDRVVDTSWDPPVTMGVRLVSVISDGLQHAGQAAYLRGVHDRTVGPSR
jgi:uncharacterized damage-inducible protein DinB